MTQTHTPTSIPSDEQRDKPPFSVLLCTYGGDSPQELGTAIGSVMEQTLLPAEVVIVEDGTLTDELNMTLQKWKQQKPDVLNIVSVKPCGFGEALRQGISACSHDLIARMDSDDVSMDYRFEEQVTFLTENPDVDAVGGYVEEVGGDLDETLAVREVPTTPSEVAETAKFRSPMNHPSVMYRKEAVLSAGNYRDIAPVEDYDLWVRMLLDGATLTNIPEILVKMRAEEDMFSRRGGTEYLKSEFRLLNEFRQWGFLSPFEFLLSTLARLPVRLLPNSVRTAIYRKLLRTG